VAIGLLMNLRPASVVSLAAILIAVLSLGSRPLGYLVQRTVTVGVDFHRASVKRIMRRIDESGAVCYYVHLDVELEDEATG